MRPDKFHLLLSFWTNLCTQKIISIDCQNHKFQIWRVLLKTSVMPSSLLLLRLLNRCRLLPWWPRNTTTLWIRTKNSLHMVLVTFSGLSSPVIHLLPRCLGHLCKILPGEGHRYRNHEIVTLFKSISFLQLWSNFDLLFSHRSRAFSLHHSFWWLSFW